MDVAKGHADARVRQHRRFPIRIPVRFFVNDSYLRGDAVTRDVTPGGVALDTYRLLPEDSPVTVILDFEGSVSLEFEGQVTWSKRDDGQATVGIRFGKGKGDDLKRLRWLLRSVKLSGRTFEGEPVMDPLAVQQAPQPAPSQGIRQPQPTGLANGTPSGGSRMPSALLEERALLEARGESQLAEPPEPAMYLAEEDDDEPTFRQQQWP